MRPILVLVTFVCIANSLRAADGRDWHKWQRKRIVPRSVSNLAMFSASSSANGGAGFPVNVNDAAISGNNYIDGNSNGNSNGVKGSLGASNFGKCQQHGATNIAIKAAQEAKSAADAQAAAGASAAREVKAQLAQKAVSAARAAEAAMIGKQEIVQQLEHEVREAEIIAEEEANSVHSIQSNAEAAMQASKQAHLQVSTLTTAVKIAEDNVNNAETAATAATQGVADKAQLVQAAKGRVEVLLRQLSVARNDYMNTKNAAQKAACSAQEAREKATKDN